MNLKFGRRLRDMAITRSLEPAVVTITNPREHLDSQATLVAAPSAGKGPQVSQIKVLRVILIKEPQGSPIKWVRASLN